MFISQIHRQIAQNLAAPNSRQLFEQRLQQLATLQGQRLDANGVASLTALTEQYVSETVDLIEACVVAANQASIGNSIAPVMEAAAQYFLAPHDYLPDHLGLYGLLDDAYLARSLIGQVSILYQQHTGVPLLPFDIHPFSGVVRALIGKPATMQLDQIVVSTIQQAVMQHQLNQMYAQRAGTLPMGMSRTGGPGSWGGTWEDEFSRQAAELGISVNW